MYIQWNGLQLSQGVVLFWLVITSFNDMTNESDQSKVAQFGRIRAAPWYPRCASLPWNLTHRLLLVLPVGSSGIIAFFDRQSSDYFCPLSGILGAVVELGECCLQHSGLNRIEPDETVGARAGFQFGDTVVLRGLHVNGEAVQAHLGAAIGWRTERLDLQLVGHAG